MRLQQKTLVIFVTLNVLAVGVTSFVIFESMKPFMIQSTIKEQNSLVIEKSKILELFLDSIKSELIRTSDQAEAVILANSILHEKIDVDEISYQKLVKLTQTSFLNKMNKDPNISSIQFIDTNGNIVIKITRNEDIVQISNDLLSNEIDEQYFQQILELPEDSIYVYQEISDSNSNLGQSQYGTIHLATPVIDLNEEKGGVIIYSVNPNTLFKIITSPIKGNLFLMDENGNPIIHSQGENNIGLNFGDDVSFFDVYPNLKSKLDDSNDYSFHDENLKTFITLGKIELNPYNEKTFWIVASVIDDDEMFATINNSFYTVISMAAIIGSLSTLAVVIYSRKITTPIIRLKEVANRITNGDLGAKANLKTNDELEDLSNSFDDMVKSLKKITDLETQLAIQQNLRRSLDESSIVSITDKNGKITYVNQKFCDASKYSRDAIIGKNHNILKSDHHHSIFFKQMWDKISSGNVWTGEIKNKTKDGAYYWVKTTIVPFLNKDGGIEEYVAVTTDITEQKEVQDKILKMERLSAIGAVAARIAHDMRNPLHSMVLAMDVFKIKDKSKLGNEKKLIEKIDRAILRMSQQIEDVLDFVRTKPLSYGRSSLLEILKRSIDSEKTPSNIRFNIPTDDYMIECDSEQIEVVFNNIIRNAIQAIPEAGTITVTFKDDGKNVIIEIQDSGPGISEEIMDKIFEPLFTTKQTGTGLGLVTCKNIVEQHNGVLTAKNNPTTFTVILPIVQLANLLN